MREYSPRALALMDGLAEELGIHLFPNLRLRNGTDGLESLAAGYPTAVLASCTDLKQPANYHWWHDLAENVDFDTVADGVRLSRSRDPPPRHRVVLGPTGRFATYIVGNRPVGGMFEIRLRARISHL